MRAKKTKIIVITIYVQRVKGQLYCDSMIFCKKCSSLYSTAYRLCYTKSQAVQKYKMHFTLTDCSYTEDKAFIIVQDNILLFCN